MPGPVGGGLLGALHQVRSQPSARVEGSATLVRFPCCRLPRRAMSVSQDDRTVSSIDLGIPYAGLLQWLCCEESTYGAGDAGSIPGWGRFPWRRKWQPTPVFLPEKFHGQRSLAGYSPQGCKVRRNKAQQQVIMLAVL